MNNFLVKIGFFIVTTFVVVIMSTLIAWAATVVVQAVVGVAFGFWTYWGIVFGLHVIGLTYTVWRSS